MEKLNVMPNKEYILEILENILYEVNKDLINNLVKSNYKKENIYEYIEERYDHNEVSWRFAFNYFMDVYLRKCGK